MSVPNFGRKYWRLFFHGGSPDNTGSELEGLVNSPNAIQFPRKNQSSVDYSADGGMVAASTGRLGGSVDFSFIAGSPGDKFLANLSQLFDEGELEMSLNFTAKHVDPSVGETTICTNGVFTDSPTAINVSGGGGTPAEMMYTIAFEKISRDLAG